MLRFLEDTAMKPVVKPEYGEGTVLRLKQKTSPTGESKFWYIQYYRDGEPIRENSKTADYKEAYDLLVTRRAEANLGQQPTKKLKYEDLRDLLIRHYTTEKTATLYKRRDGFLTFPGRACLDEFFRNRPVSQITTDELREFIGYCQDEGESDPSIRRFMVCLRSAFGLAFKEGLLYRVPHFPFPKDSEPAGQYVDPKTFEALLATMPEVNHPLFVFLYATSCRIGAARQITWDMISPDATLMKLPGIIVKQKEPLTIVLAGTALENLSTMFRKMFREQGSPVFDVTNYRKVWYDARNAIKLGVYDPETKRFEGPRIHDLRCSGAINMIDAGVPEDLVMKIGGWKTRAMFSRYNVINTDRIRAAMIQASAHVERLKQA
jgi:integrase